MLAGRAITRKFFPLVWVERNEKVEIDKVLKFGNLPEVCKSIDDAVDILEAYVATYLQEEIAQESLEADIGSFVRYLEVAGILNGEIISVSSVSRDCGVKRNLIEKYYQISEATLIGSWLPAFNPRLKVKEYSKPKFYFFDTGVVRGLTGRLREPLDSSEAGTLFETLVFNELRSAMNYLNTGGKLSFWETASSKEVDFIWSRGDTVLGFEVKYGKRWRRNYGRGLKELLKAKIINRAYGIYSGDSILKDGDIEVLPFSEFAKSLAAGKIIN